MTAEPTWGIPGYVADQLVGVGPLGETWTGRDTADGTAVTLEELGPVSQGVVDSMRTFGRFPPEGHPHLWAVREVVVLPGRTVLVRDRPPGGSLATLLLHRRRLRPGEVVTVVAPLASALAELHDELVLHGVVTPERIVFDIDGRPLLAGVGVDLLLGVAAPDRVPAAHLDPAVAAGAEPSWPTDVYMLASCGLLALGGAAAPEPLLAALRAALHPDPAERPTARELGAAVRASCPPEPVQLLVPEPSTHTLPPEWTAANRPDPSTPGVDDPELRADGRWQVADRLPGRSPDPPDDEVSPAELAEWIASLTGPAATPARPAPAGDPEPAGADPAGPAGPPRAGPAVVRLAGRVTRGRRVAVAVFVAGLLVLAGAIWFRLPAAEPETVATPATPAPAATDRWTRVLDGLDAVRATAYERGDVAMLGRVWVSGPRLVADAAQLRSLLATGCTARGVRHRFDGVAVLGVDGGRVRLRVTQWLPSSQRLRGGRVVGAIDGSPPATVPLDLVATGSGWRLG